MIDTSYLEFASKEYEENSVTLRKSLRFAGKSLEEWSIKLSIEFPDDMNFVEVQNLSVELDNCFILAYNNLIVASGVKSFLERTLDVDTTKAYISLDKDNSGGRKTIVDKERLVDAQVKDQADKVSLARFVHEFWQEQVRLLERRQKLLEQIFWTIKQQEKNI